MEFTKDISKLVVYILVAGFFVLGVVGANADTDTDTKVQKCTVKEIDLKDWLTKLIAKNTDSEVVRLNPLDRGFFMLGYNRYPPVTEFNPEQVMLFYKPGYEAVVVAFSKGNCLYRVDTAPWKYISAWGLGHLRVEE